MPIVEPYRGGRSWRDLPDAAPAGAGRRAAPVVRRAAPGRWVTAVAATLFLLFCGGLVWLITWLMTPPPVRVVLLSAGYEQNLAVPENVYGRRWADGLARLTVPGGPLAGSFRLDGGAPAEFRARARWDAGLRGRPPRTVLVAFAAHGGADAAGPYLLPTDAAPGPGGENRLRLTAVLDRLADLPPATQKVLVLDATRIPANPLFGMLENDFAGGLDRLADRVGEIPNLVVVSASGPGERSWPAERYGETAFGHYLLAGLAGAADADRDRRLTAWEVYDYLVPRVERWAAGARGTVQRPVLYPRGPEGERRARAVTLAVLPADALPTDESAEPEFAPPESLTAAWARHARLDALTPHPAAYGPHLWRMYQATLLRYEQLLAARDTTAVDGLVSRLDGIERELEARRRVELWPDAATASVSGAADPDPAAVAAAGRALTALWAAPPAGRDGPLAEVAAGGAVARREAYAWLVGRAIEDPANNLGKAAELARRLDAPGSPRPPDVHLLVMLAAHLPPQADPQLVGTALRVRQLAEQAAVGWRNGPGGYGERVMPWLAARLRAADAARVEAEDLLFATDPGERCRAQLRAAGAGYEAVLRDAGLLRAAYRVRDRLLADLPHYAEWAAGEPGTDRLPAARDPGSAAVALEKLWDDAHALAAALDSPGAGGLEPEAAADLAARADGLAARLKALADQVTADVAGLVPAPPADARPVPTRDQIARALTVPTLDPALRAKLLAVADRLAREAGPLPDGASPLEVPAGPPAGRRTGLLALAGIGRGTFDALAAPGAANYAATRDRLAAAADAPSDYTAAGEQIEARLVRLPREARRRLETDPSAAPAVILAATLTADRFARLVPAGLPLPSPDPATALRGLLAQNLMIALAGRAAAEGWAADDPRAEPYDRARGGAYLAAAATAGPVESVRQAVREVRARLDRPFEPTLSVPAGAEVTDPTPFPVEVVGGFPPRDDLFPGSVTLWAEPTEGVAAVGGRAAVRVPRPWPGPQQATFEFVSPQIAAAGADPTAARVAAGVVARGFFRGWEVRRAVGVDVYPQPDILARSGPPPAGVGLAVRAGRDVVNRFGVGDGAVAIVLDCSGSMAAPAGRPPEEARLREAIRAVTRIVTGLPRETTISVWAFGQSGEAGRRVDPAERTIARVAGPVRWDPDDPAALAALTARLSALEPFNESPLYRALLAAREDVLPATGYRAVVLVSDGADNRFATDKELNPDRLPADAAVRMKLLDGRVVVHAVGFPPKTADEESAARRVRQLVEGLPTPGKYVTVPDIDDVIAALRDGLSPRLRCRLTTADIGGRPAADVDVAVGGTADRWAHPAAGPGRYELSAAGMDVSSALRLGPGDQLLLGLLPGPRGPAFRRLLYSADYPGKPAADSDRKDWRLTVLQNQRVGAGLRMLVTLENTDPAALAVVRPVETWIELGTDLETLAPPALRWQPAPGYPAPAWNVEVPAWPAYAASGTPARPVLRVWWDEAAQAAPAAALPLASLADGRPVPVQVGTDEVTVEVGEPGRVAAVGGPVRPGAVVIRVRHHPDRPVVARLDGIDVAEYEHRLYARAGRYTGLFWPAGRADRRAARVLLIPLARFKAESQRIEVRGLGPPDPNDDRPARIDAAAGGR